ncbi:MAG TPA: LacI family DNA-binding transcriptional regulator [Acidobacteriaceae bacterium]|jgi:LacI family transcriptional regulator|nr:LacI family DNA-binding transcriptional regulator [Acidobacteriaceae bacterium]
MNITAVAKRAGVSTATVSRVMNGTANVSPETAERVREAVEALNFYPDVNARALGSGRSGLYGLIISDITNPYFPELVKAFEDIAVEHGQDVLIANTDYDPKRMETCVIRMLQRKVDGVAVMTSEMEERLIRTFSQRQIPTIFMDTATAVKGASTVNVDYAAGVAQAMQHLFSLGHKRIAFISGPLTLASARTRADAFQKALKDHGLPVPAGWLQEGDHRVEGGHHAMKQILKSGDLPTAVMGSNDLTAIGAMGAIHESGLQVPGDISVIGFDDIELSGYTSPALTTLHVPRRELAAMAFRSLFRGREETPAKNSRKRDHTIEPRLLIRQSTGPARQEEKVIAGGARRGRA